MTSSPVRPLSSGALASAQSPLVSESSDSADPLMHAQFLFDADEPEPVATGA